MTDPVNPSGGPAGDQDAPKPATRRRRVPAPVLSVERLPELRRPIMLCAFAGWNDAAQSATGALRYLIERYSTPRFAGIDPEPFYVFTETRPTIRLVDGVQRTLEWPANDFHYWHNPRQDRDLVLLTGIEPQMQWRAFSGAILDLARRLDASMVMMLGGLLADVPYAPPVKITGAATHPDLLARWPEIPVRNSRYEGPTGIVGVLSDLCRRSGVPSASLWANVPHYINVSPNPKTLAALVHQIDRLFDLDLDLFDLDEASDRFDRQVEEALEQNPEVKQYVRQLEDAVDEEPSEPPAELPSGAAIVEELEEFLRQLRGENDEED